MKMNVRNTRAPLQRAQNSLQLTGPSPLHMRPQQRPSLPPPRYGCGRFLSLLNLSSSGLGAMRVNQLAPSSPSAPGAAAPGSPYRRGTRPRSTWRVLSRQAAHGDNNAASQQAHRPHPANGRWCVSRQPMATTAAAPQQPLHMLVVRCTRCWGHTGAHEACDMAHVSRVML